MSNLHLDLSFERNDGSGLPGPSIARIYVKFSSGVEGDSHSYISPDCASAAELDQAVDHLQKELEKIRARGHALFAHQRS
jgi:hypothetical protein